ncbi:MAG: SMI1/KNR4 family protein [Polyangiaceae bacterium]|nr:SMI1/KNR4 family protein [Polyangiaceae bacterium]
MAGPDPRFFEEIARWLRHAPSGHDPRFERLGARGHRYQLGAPLTPEQLARLEREHGVRLPDDYASFVTRVGHGGAGPYYGLLPLLARAQLASLGGGFPATEAVSFDEADEMADGDEHVRGTVALAHQGCGYFSLLVVEGPRRGTVWADLRAAGRGLVPTHGSFVEWYLAWVSAVASGDELYPPLEPGACGPPKAISELLLGYERERRLPSGSLTPVQVREALGEIGEGGLTVRAGATTRYFDAGDPVDLCPNCSHMVRHFVAAGAMRWEQVAPGGPPKAWREGAS